MKIMKPSITTELDAVEDLLPLISLSKEEESDIYEKHIKGVTLIDTDISKVSLKETIFENCKFVDYLLQKSDFVDVIFKSCDLSNSNFNDGYFNKCQFISCKAVGVNFQNVKLQNISILNSNFKYANFDTSKLSDLSIVDSDMSNANISECKLTNLESKDVNFIGTSFFKTPLKGVDLTLNLIDGIIVSGAELKGAIVSASQATELAKLLGLIVK